MMRPLKMLLAFLLFINLLLPTGVSAQNPQDFKVDRFLVEYRLTTGADSSSQMRVDEVIVAHFPQIDQNHGILRAIPQTYQDHSLGLKINSVQNEAGQPHQFTTYEQNDNLVLRIGDPDKFVHGEVTYRISYTMRDVISFYPSHDEFFWDANGDQWQQPFGWVTAKVVIDKTLIDSIQEGLVCYVGSFGSKDESCFTDRYEVKGNTVYDFQSTNLQPGETMSFALKFKPGTFKYSSAVEREILARKVSIAIGAVALLLLPLATGVYMYRRWREFGDDPKGRGVIVPQYEQPKGFDALRSDFLLKQELRNKAISSMLLELAVSRHLTIYEIPKKGLFGKKDYELELIDLPQTTDELTREAVEIIFGGTAKGTRVKLSDLKDRSRQMAIYNGLKKLEDKLASRLHTLGYFIKNPKKVKSGYRMWSVLILVSAVAVGFFGFTFMVWALIGLSFGLGLTALVVFIFSFIMPARTLSGVEAHDALLGLEDYIKLAEADRLRYLQSPEGAEKITEVNKFNPKTNAAKVKLFEGLLPYAMLFGLEKQWAEQFKSIFTSPPDWYHGNWTAFNAGHLGSSLSGFSSASAGAFSTPSSSGSGFSGGGGAGGGGGGGGGGGW